MSDEPRTVWAVSSGEYSDYRVLALFEREEDANAAAAAKVSVSRYYSDAPFVEQFTLFPAGMLPKKVTYWRAWTAVNADGTARAVDTNGTLSTRRDEGWTGIDTDIPGRRPTVTVTECRWNHDGPVLYWNIQAVAPTEQAAIKAASDRAAHLRAEAIERERAKPTPARAHRLAELRRKHRGMEA